MQFIITETDEVLISNGGLAMIGALLQGTSLQAQMAAIQLDDRPQPEVPHGDVVSAMLGLLCLGKSDYADIEAFRGAPFFGLALGLRLVPSEETLRQRLDQLATHAQTVLRNVSVELLRQHARPLTPCYGAWLPLDIDVSPFDNSGTKKEGVSYTYKGHDGYAPIFGYLGLEGYLIDCELRIGSQHCQQGTPEFLDRCLTRAAAVLSTKRAAARKLLVRLDAGNDAEENVKVCRRHKADWIIKRNLRHESPEDWLEKAKAYGEWEIPRKGKVIYRGETWREQGSKLQRVVFEVVHRTIDREGQRLLVPQIDVATWWTSLKLPAQTVIALYHAHGTSEQFHSEIKTDLDLERLPSGKFATNALMLLLGMVAYNLLRLCGQESLRVQRRLPAEQRAPLEKPVFRRRLGSVIRDLMYLAAKLVRHSNRWQLVLWQNSLWRATWRELYQRFSRPLGVRSG
jgi:hypothetical protein